MGFPAFFYCFGASAMRKRTPHLFCRKASMMEPAPAWEITRDALDICKARCKWYGSTINWATTQTANVKITGASGIS